MNREKILTIVLAVGVIFLLFYWTHQIFQSKAEEAISSKKTYIKKAEKAQKLIAKTSTGSTMKIMSRGLLSFVQNRASSSGLSQSVASIKPKNIPGSKEAAFIRLQNLNYNQAVLFIRSMEQYSNIEITHLKISKRFDNENMIDLVMDIAKR